MSNESSGKSPSESISQYSWRPEPTAAAWLRDVLTHAMNQLPWTVDFANRLRQHAGVRLIDLVETVFLSRKSNRLPLAIESGWIETPMFSGTSSSVQCYRHPGGLFPTVAVHPDLADEEIEISIKVEFVGEFLAMNDLSRTIEGRPWAPYRKAVIESAKGKASFSVAERHGMLGFEAPKGPDVREVLEVFEAFTMRRRDFDSDEEAMHYTNELVDEGIARIGRDYACDRFFAAERIYWQKRNLAARIQKGRQDLFGIGWANHDHHTYRSSRNQFKALVSLWEKFGFYCRERFYAGIEAGWGAQVMEQPITGIVTFNDVDLSPEELVGDFSHDGLVDQKELRTIGLWCGLHGEAIHSAGMHHLEGTFDFEALRTQLEAQAGIRTMKPFTDFPHLKQAFTEGERWPVKEERLQRLITRKLISQEQADGFRKNGAIGSHLENLERNQGFKGFNQKGVSEIIAATDPRCQTN